MVTMMRTRDIQALQHKAARSRCAKHPNKMLVVINDKIICWFCDGPPQSFKTLPSETEKYMTGLTQSAAIHSMMSQKHGAWEMPGTTTTEVTDVALIEPTQTDIERVGKKFAELVEHFGATGDAQLSPADVMLAAKLEMAGFQHFHLYVDQRNWKDKQGQWHVKARLRMNIAGRTFNAQRSMGATYGGVTIEIITDETIKEAADVPKGEVLVKATLSQKAADGTLFVREEEYGRAGGPRDENQPVAKNNKLEMATTRAKGRVLEKGCALGVHIETYDVVGGVGVVVSDGPEQVKAIEAATPATRPEPDETNEGNSPEWKETTVDQLNALNAEVDKKTGEIKTVNRNNAENRQELADRLKANGITKEQVESLNINPSQMLIDGDEPHVIADAISALLTKPAEQKVIVEGDDEIQDLPW